MKKIIKYLTIVIGLMFMGCSQQNLIMPYQGEPTIPQTPYSQIRDDMNSMIAVFYGKPIRVLIDAIENKTKEQVELPSEISDIVKTSFNEIGTNVNTIANPEMAGDKLTFIIHGAITKYDVVEVESRGNNIDIEGGKGKGEWTNSMGLDRESKIAKLAINFNPENMATGSFVSKSSTSNEITIYQKSSANEFGFSILGSGFGYNKTITRTQGTHSSIAILVDLSVAELLGKIAKFPYWLLTKGKANKYILNKLSDEFLDNKLSQKLYKISYLLALRDGTVSPTRVMTPSLGRAIRTYKRSHGMRDNLYLTQMFYRSLLGG